jgi:rhamnosyltransferase
MTSIIIPTWNAEKNIDGLLKSVKSQSVPCEMIVVDSSSTDNTVKIAESYGIKAITIEREEFDHGGTRTLAGKATQGDILIFLTQDAMPFNNYAVENLLKPFEDLNIGAAYGRQLPYPDTSQFGTHNRLFNYPESSCIRSYEDKEKYKIKTPFLSNAFAAYRKKALEDIGGFKENLISTEDTYAGAKLLLAGYKIAYVSDAMVYHSHSYTVFEEFRRYFDIGVFHKKEKWISEEFGGAGTEGMRYIRSELAFLLNNRKCHLLPEFVIRNVLKYLGFNIGKNYEKIPGDLVKKMSMNKMWWEKII